MTTQRSLWWMAVLMMVAWTPLLPSLLTAMVGSPRADAGLFFYDVLFASLRAWKEGEWPLLWTPLMTGGQPFLGNGQTLQLYPPMMAMTAWFGVVLGYNISIIAHLFGFAWLCRLWLSGDGWVRTGLAVAISMGSMVAARVFAGHVLFVLSLPWLMLLAIMAQRHADGRCTTPVAMLLTTLATAALGLGGSPQLSVYAAVAVVIVLVWRRQWRTLLVLGIGACWGAVIASPQLVAMASFIADATRGGLSGDDAARFAGSFAVPWRAWLTLPSAWLLGDSEGLHGLWWEQNISVGMAITVLSLSTWWTSSRRWWWLLLVCFAMVVSVGPATPLWPIIVKVVPVLQPFRCPGRVVLVLMPLLLWPAMHACGAAEDDRKRRIMMVITSMMAVLVTILILLADIDARAWLAVITAVAMLIVLYRAPQQRGRWLAGIAGVEGALAFALSLSSFEPDAHLSPPARYVAEQMAPGTTVAMVGQPNAGMRVNVVNVLGYDPLCLRRVDRLLAALRGQPLDAPLMGCRTTAAVEHPALRRLGVSVIVPTSSGDIAEASPGPAAWLVFNADISDDDHAAQRVAELNNVVDPLSAATVMTTAVPLAREGDQVRVLSSSAERQTLEVSCAQACTVVQRAPFARGWHARVGDKELPIIVADAALRAVVMPAGTSVLEMEYQPTGWRWSCTMAIIASALWLLAAIVVIKRRY